MELKYHEILFKMCCTTFTMKESHVAAWKTEQNREINRSHQKIQCGLLLSMVTINFVGIKNSTFPLGVYGFIDTFSRKILSLKVMISNSDPRVNGKQYFDLLYELKMMPVFLRCDRGTETGKMASIHCYLMSAEQSMFFWAKYN